MAGSNANRISWASADNFRQAPMVLCFQDARFVSAFGLRSDGKHPLSLSTLLPSPVVNSRRRAALRGASRHWRAVRWDLASMML
jgi:hypothetical protein